MTPTYKRVPLAEDNDELSVPVLEDQRPARQSEIWRRFVVWAPYLVHFMLLLAYFVAYQQLHKHVGGDLKWPNVYNNFPPESRQRRTIGSSHHTEFQGRPSETVERAWRDLLSAGIVGITAEEAARLPLHTTPDMKNPDTFVVELDVFHQLHCLYMLRKQVWEPTVISWRNREEVGFWELHIDHCIEHLRQTLMCNADTTPQRYLWDSTAKGYTLPNRQEFMCKDFDAIRGWAEKRNTTGLTPMAVGGEDKKEQLNMEDTTGER